eukprot:comp23967_c0_seq1/m.42484 comp23967_c0_seq1/g.42484  ORF comp23967_c0_seq1/g.42484 comp23967_c0_seq1/m.42484 type:complete len:851 (-) comp23967_c0_seq1:245-2797(-)
MGKLLRSQQMTLVQLIIQSDAAYESVGQLGELGIIQFKDLNHGVNAFQRSFVKDIRRCEEMERKLRFFARQMETSGICAVADDLLDFDCCKKHRLPSQQELEELDGKLSQLETEVRGMNDNEADLQRNDLGLMELQQILNMSARYFDESGRRDRGSLASAGDQDMEALLAGSRDASRGVRVGFKAGVIDREKFAAFERVMWRGSRGNVFLRHEEVPTKLKDPTTGEWISKVVFLAFYQGEVLDKKVQRICDGFQATLYPCPDNYTDRRTLQQKVASNISELEMVLKKTAEYRRKVMVDMAGQYEEWYVKIKKAKATYHQLNMHNYDVSGSALIGEGWVPTERLPELQETLTRVYMQLGADVPTIVKRINTVETPPTLHAVNKFSSGVQTVIDAYGVASYQEVNPGLFSLITFPFLFAVMFGDLGHGFLMAAAAFYLIINEKRLGQQRHMGEMFGMIFGGRYVIFMMGLFSMYTGAIYNDIFSKSMWVFPSGWTLPTVPFNGTMNLNPQQLVNSTACPEGCGFSNNPYPFGVDPIWALTENKLNFLNSLKMKMSILIGVIHMMSGTMLSLVNFIYFKDYVSTFGVFIPQLLFMGCLFGYLCILIIYKWLQVYGDITVDGHTYSADPSLLITLINMFLKPGNNNYPEHTMVYEGEATVETGLVLIALVCVPWMLLAKPFYLRWQHNKKLAAGYGVLATAEEGHVDIHEGEGEDGVGHAVSHGHGHDGEFDFSEEFVHQAIHTIEYCLGAVSNTASYLRLWALSLAHAQLSDVLWNMVLKNAINMSGPAAFVGFGAWSVMTVAVLLLMEGMSAFLHAMRLHWVEFNSKFYIGTGYPFVAYSFADNIGPSASAE